MPPIANFKGTLGIFHLPPNRITREAADDRKNLEAKHAHLLVLIHNPNPIWSFSCIVIPSLFMHERFSWIPEACLGIGSAEKIPLSKGRTGGATYKI